MLLLEIVYNCFWEKKLWFNTSAVMEMMIMWKVFVAESQIVLLALILTGSKIKVKLKLWEITDHEKKNVSNK